LFVLVVVFAGLLAFIVEVLPVFDGVLTGAGVLTLIGVDVLTGAVLFAGLALLVLSAPPHAIPSAPRLRTAESTITFFIVVFKTPVFSKNKYLA